MKNILLLLGLLILLRPIFPVIDYVVNYDYIAKVLCENKEKPQMNCNGKCHLMKEMAKASENEKPLSQNQKVSMQESEILFVVQLPTYEINLSRNFITKICNSLYCNWYNFRLIELVFHPPIV